MASITATGFPEIHSCRLFQKGTAESGRCVLHTAHEAGQVPDLTTLTITTASYTGNWPLRVVKRARLERDQLLWVLEDSRWSLDEAVMGESYNRRDHLGQIEPATSKTITQLWALIATATGLSITVGTVPSFQPPAPWKGWTARQAVEQLLCDTFCFMNWDAVSQTYRIEAAGTGSLPPFAQRTYGPGPQQKINQLYVDSAPITYESDLDAKAVLKDPNGEIVTLKSLVDVMDIFDGFKDTANLIHRSRYQQTAFRLWRVTQANFPSSLTPEFLVLLDQRAMALASGGNNHLTAMAHPASKDYAIVDFPGFQYPNTTDDNDGDTPMEVLDGTELLFSHRPIFVVDGDGVLQEDLKIHTGFHVEENGNLKRYRETRSVHGVGDTLRIFVDWIRPYETDLPDGDTSSSQWQTVLAAAANALQTKWLAQRQTASTDDFIPGTSGQVGAVLFEGSSGYRGELRTTWAFNFVPSEWRGLRG